MLEFSKWSLELGTNEEKLPVNLRMLSGEYKQHEKYFLSVFDCPVLKPIMVTSSFLNVQTAQGAPATESTISAHDASIEWIIGYSTS